ncbi:MAG TPA: M56 family metallopeptidase [Gemmatimonadaceae bacterium]|nr:M56 family metallopeptidase [Gemmatimonadaceae bacterium]
MIALMLYSAFIALIIAAAARAAEWLVRLVGFRVRWIWAGALLLTVALSASALLRDVRSIAATTTISSTIDLNAAAHERTNLSLLQALTVLVDNVRRTLDAPLRGAVAAMHRTMPAAANVYAASVASVISFGLVLLLIGVGRRFRRARRAWPLVTMEGVDVRVAPHIGPVVIGLVRPEIVVPRWLLARLPDEQRLVVTHEDEHIRARDPLLLGLAWGAVIIAPWNPALWYMLSRLRLAVELDCDARVLRRGAAPRSYGFLLIDVAQHASALRLSALALADDSSHLHQRILAMKPTVPRFARLRGGVAAMFALAGVLVACEAKLPTDAEIEQMDVATATRTARELARGTHADTGIAYTVDGVAATVAEASALTPRELDKVQIVTAPAGKLTRIAIETRKRASMKAASDSTPLKRRQPMPGELPSAVEGLVLRAPDAGPLPQLSRTAFTGLIFIDGVRSTESQIKLLDRTQIESVEILKGPAAALAYGPGGANGVIAIKTKPAGAK